MYTEENTLRFNQSVFIFNFSKSNKKDFKLEPLSL
jgi:hypothetical protein